MTYLTRSAVLLRYREHAISNGLDPDRTPPAPDANAFTTQAGLSIPRRS